MIIDQATAKLNRRFSGGKRILFKAALQDANRLKQIRKRHADAFADFLADMDAGEDAWDEYLTRLGQAHLFYKSRRKWAIDRIEGCERGDPHPGCGCYECALHLDLASMDQLGFYACHPIFDRSECLRAGLLYHNHILFYGVYP